MVFCYSGCQYGSGWLVGYNDKGGTYAGILCGKKKNNKYFKIIISNFF
jgi:hypothetical protein